LSRLRSIAREASPAVPIGAIERIGAIALGRSITLSATAMARLRPASTSLR
jgi:hypothetical protein